MALRAESPAPSAQDASRIGAMGARMLLEALEEISEGAVGVDAAARVTWVNEKYCRLLGIESAEAAIGRPIEEVIPESRLREVVTSGKPIVLDILSFGERQFVVTRLPLRGPKGEVTGAVGLVLYDRLDYLKPILSRFESLRASLARSQADLAAARRARYALSNYVGHGAAADTVRRLARRSAASDSPVLLTGETGTGKEMLAQAIHNASARAAKPFVAVNVAAVPETLLESEFFGVVPGAFTGADRRAREGKFQIAEGGTLFLDEIGDMPAGLQAKLLRALQEQEVEPVGSNRVVKTNVRVISATSHDLRRRIEEGRFRADLYYRLAVLPIDVPPLRARVEDIPALAEMLLEDIARRAGVPPFELAADAVALLARHDWPGNVRELRNVLERACTLGDGNMLDAEALGPFLPGPAAGAAFAQSPAGSLDAALIDAEKTAIRDALRRAGGNRAAAARLLGISRSRLYEKLQTLAVDASA